VPAVTGRLALASLALVLALFVTPTAAAAPLPLKRYDLTAEVRVTHDWAVSGSGTRRASGDARIGYTFRGRRNGLPLETRTRRSLRLTFERPG
jgi:hypothetical protein